jgi:hypothetical protein
MFPPPFYSLGNKKTRAEINKILCTVYELDTKVGRSSLKVYF